MSDAKRRLDRQNAERSQAMAREAAQVLADEKVRLEGLALSRPDRESPSKPPADMRQIFSDGDNTHRFPDRGGK